MTEAPESLDEVRGLFVVQCSMTEERNGMQKRNGVWTSDTDENRHRTAQSAQDDLKAKVAELERRIEALERKS